MLCWINSATAIGSLAFGINWAESFWSYAASRGAVWFFSISTGDFVSRAAWFTWLEAFIISGVNSTSVADGVTVGYATFVFGCARLCSLAPVGWFRENTTIGTSALAYN